MFPSKQVAVKDDLTGAGPLENIKKNLGFIGTRRWEIRLSRKSFKIIHNCKREISRQSKTDISRKQDNNNDTGGRLVGAGYWK